MRGADTFTRRILVEMSQDDLEAFTAGLRAFIKASEFVSTVEPNLASVAMTGANPG
jgi:hypothetical protein